MTDSTTFFRDNHNLHSPNFTNFYTMENKKTASQSFQDLKKELQIVTQQEGLKLTGGKSIDTSVFNTVCGGIVPQ
jgi:hypothetical protein